ncbi:hypothetical protein [Nostoc sp.]
MSRANTKGSPFLTNRLSFGTLRERVASPREDAKYAKEERELNSDARL